MQPSGFDSRQNYFQLFGLAQSYQTNIAVLEQDYRALQTRIHPDKFTHLSDTEQRIAMQHATWVNEAYQTLRNPLRRARYLLTLQGIDTQEETNTAMPLDFLIAQMEWREAVVAAQQQRDVAALEKLEVDMRDATLEFEAQLATKLDSEKDFGAAAALVRKLRFMEKLAEEIHSAYDAIES